MNLSPVANLIRTARRQYEIRSNRMNLSPVANLIRTARRRMEDEIAKGTEKQMGAGAFNANFRILNFNLGRGAGHTSFIVEDFVEGEDLAIVPAACEEMFKGAKGVVTNFDDALRYLEQGRGRSTRDIWIDEPTLHLRTDADVRKMSTVFATWRSTTRHSDGMVIFMGGHMR